MITHNSAAPNTNLRSGLTSLEVSRYGGIVVTLSNGLYTLSANGRHIVSSFDRAEIAKEFWRLCRFD